MPDADEQTPNAVPDSVLLASVDVARAALLEVTPSTTVGAVVGHIVEGEHVLSLLFECTMPGYPGWHWTVTISRIDDESEPSLLETELMPGEHALLAPDWVPWSERLADYQAAQEALHLAEADAADEGDEDDDEFDDESDDDDFGADDESDDDDDDDDDDDSGAHLLHGGDIDGVDIDDVELELDDADIDVTLDLEAEESAALEDDPALEGYPAALEGEGSAASDGQVDEADEAEAEPDHGGPQPPAVA